MRKINFKRILFSLLIVILAVLFAGCGAASIPMPTPQPGITPSPVSGSCDIEINGDIITVSGQTNLMDSVILNVSIVGQDGMTIDSENIVQEKSGQNISQDFAIDEEYKDIVSVTGYISCAPSLYGKQSESVLNRYGQKFENISSENNDYVWGHNGNVIVFASEALDLPK